MLAKIITFGVVALLATVVAAADVPTPHLTLSDCPTWVPECKSNSAFPFFTPAPTPTGDAFPTKATHPAIPVNDEYVIAGRAVDAENRVDSVFVLEPTVVQEGGESVTVYHTLSYPETVTQTVFLSSAETSVPSESVASVSNSEYPSASESQTSTSFTTTSVTSTTSHTVWAPSSGSETPSASTPATETATPSSASVSETPGSTSVPSEVTSWTTETATQPSTLVTATGSPSSSGTGTQSSTTASASHSHSASSSGTSAGSSSSGTPTHPSASATASSQASGGRAAQVGGAVLAGLGGMIVLFG